MVASENNWVLYFNFKQILIPFFVFIQKTHNYIELQNLSKVLQQCKICCTSLTTWYNRLVWEKVFSSSCPWYDFSAFSSFFSLYMIDLCYCQCLKKSQNVGHSSTWLFDDREWMRYWDIVFMLQVQSRFLLFCYMLLVFYCILWCMFKQTYSRL